MDDILNFGECYICLEDTPLLSPCKCVERYLCENCMEKLRIYNYKRCTVCGTKYPKVYEEIIDVHIDIEPDEEFTCLPCCLRKRGERHLPKYCILDLFVHIVCIYIIMIIASCWTATQFCYGMNSLHFFVPACVAYFVFCALVIYFRR